MDYIDLVEWQSIDRYDPPIMRIYSEDRIRAFVDDCHKLDQAPIGHEFTRFPCHTQAVERCIKFVTEAAASVLGQERRDGFIRARL